MNSTKIDPMIQRKITDLMVRYQPLEQIVAAISHAGGRALLVGGAVRDLLLGLPVKDMDIEVHGLTLEQLEQLLKQFGPVSLVGKVFGVLRVHGLDADWSLPRTDSSGRKPTVVVDPHMGIKEAFRRRDLTINAMGIDLHTHELLDPFGGQEDLKKQLLRSPDPQFFEQDPLRLFRVMQFIGRFDMQPDKELNAICEKMDITSVSVERIEQEFYKLFLKSKRPSLGIRWLDEIGRLKEIMPELAATKAIVQEPYWHPEGDVFEHTMQTVDAAAQMDYGTPWNKLVLVYAALCHDLGKVSTTETKDGAIISHGHAEEGVQLTKKMLKRICRNKMLIETVCKLVRYHMQPVQLVQGHSKPAAYKRLANKLAPQATLFMLAQLSLADRRGRNPNGHTPLIVQDPDIETFLKKAQGLKVLVQVEEPLLLGRDLINEVEPGPMMGKLLKQAYEIQIEEGIKDKEELKRRILKKE